jgi:ribosomal protein S27E
MSENQEKPNSDRTIQNLGLCPKCGGNTNTFRHPGAKVWCESCGFVVREEKKFGVC